MRKTILVFVICSSLIVPFFLLPSTTYATGEKIAFTSMRDGNAEIYIMNTGGSEQKRLTDNSTADTFPSFSPGGTKIAFQSNRDSYDQIYIMNSDGTNQVNLSNISFNEYNPAFAPDGTKIAFESYRTGYIESWFMNPDGTNPTRLTFNAAYDHFLAYSPDSKKLAFTSYRKGNPNIYIMDAIPGANQTQLTDNTAEDSNPAFSPDGKKIAFQSNRDGNLEIYIMNIDGSDQSRLTYNTITDSSPVFSPDGTKIAFESKRDDNFEIYIMNIDGSDQSRITYNTSDDLYPAFSTSISSISPSKPITPEDLVLMDLNINQLLDLYGATPEGFVKMLYDIILNRVPDDKGLSDWVAALGNGMGASEVANYLVFSDELNSKTSSMSSEEFVAFLYKQVIDRKPDNDGYNSWLNFIANGNSKPDTLSAFLNNEEWFNICRMFNVTP